ncbi:phosphonate C-P lyase system protein PhnH [Streptomyces sp. NPDC001508]|uniref:phosphonate C-P lyase system protein PhnH n=1 Tax=Streptomyces sp. NPDC001508 TaxID=3154656 RepID=UPI003327CE55
MTYATQEVMEGHDHFRAAMVALSYPGRRIPVEDASRTHRNRTGRQILRALYDDETPVTTVAADGTTTGATPEEARVLVVNGSTSHGVLSRIPRGTEEYPERGATVIYLVAGLPDAAHLHLTGPGVDGDLEVRLPLALDDVMARNAACREKPTGVDLLLAGDGWVTGLPRTTSVQQVD